MSKRENLTQDQILEAIDESDDDWEENDSDASCCSEDDGESDHILKIKTLRILFKNTF